MFLWGGYLIVMVSDRVKSCEMASCLAVGFCGAEASASWAHTRSIMTEASAAAAEALIVESDLEIALPAIVSDDTLAAPLAAAPCIDAADMSAGECCAR